jgi:glucose/arabinose dehydrogenase
MRTTRVVLLSSLTLAAAAACTSGTGQTSGGSGSQSASASGGGAPIPTPVAPANCTPLETRATTASGQSPAFAGQTRTCGVNSNVAHDVVVVARGLVSPWAIEPLPGGDLLVTEKPGTMRIVSATGTIGEPLTGLPPVQARGQGGLLDVALSPQFASNRTIFWSYTEPREGGNGTSIARGELSADRKSLQNVRVIFRVLPTFDGQQHFGSRIDFDREGKLYATFGDRSVATMRPHAQRMDGHLGKIIRINQDGSVPNDNPFVGRADAKPEIWSVGHRNVQAFAFDLNGQPWDIEHGTSGGDELNRVQKGKNYGWPLQAYGQEYRGVPIEGSVTNRPEFEQPTYYWDPVIAPSGAQFYSGNAFPAWRGSLFIGALKEMRLVRLGIANNRVVTEEHLLVGRGQRIRDVKQGPDGLLYLVTDNANGEVWKIVPKS